MSENLDNEITEIIYPQRNIQKEKEFKNNDETPTLADEGWKEKLTHTPNQEGKYFGRYEILEKIGKGGMGEVYKAYDSQLQRVVALKLPIFQETPTPTHMERFLREAKTTAGLRHPNIVTVYDIGLEGNQPFLVMEFIKGVSLREYVRENKLSYEVIAEILYKVLNALEYAHKQNIIHRDLKPENIMMEDGEPKVMDFGLAKVHESSQLLSQTGMIIGTPQYMPPEQATGDVKSMDHRSDIYSVGIILYELMCGQPPFSADSLVNLIYKILNDEPIYPKKYQKQIPIELENIALKAIQKDKRYRYDNAESFAQDIKSYTEGKTVKAKPPSKMRKLAHRHFSKIVFLIMLLIISGLLFFLKDRFFLQKTPENLIQSLKEKDIGKKFVVMQTLISMGKKAAPALIKSLADKDHVIRKTSQQILVYSGVQAEEDIIKNLQNKNEIIALSCLEILGKIKNGSEKYIHAIMKALDVGSEKFRKRAPQVLNTIAFQVKNSQDIFLEYMATNQVWKKEIIIDVLSQMPFNENIVNIIIKTLMYKDKRVRIKAAKAINKLGTKAISKVLLLAKKAPKQKRLFIIPSLEYYGDNARIEILIHNLKDTDVEIRDISLHTLIRLEISAVPALIKLFSHRHPYIRKCAVIALSKIGVPSISFVLECLENRIRNVRVSARETLQGIGKICIPELKKIAMTCSTYAAVEVAKALGTMGEEAVPILIQMLERKHFEVRIQVIIALGNIGPKATLALPRLIKLFEFSNYAITRTVAKTVGKIGKDALPYLKKTLQSDLENIRVTTLRAMKEIKDEAISMVPDIIKIIENDPSVSCKYHAVEALSAIGPKASNVLPLIKSELKKTKDSTYRTSLINALIFLEADKEKAADMVISILRRNTRYSVLYALMKLREKARKSINKALKKQESFIADFEKLTKSEQAQIILVCQTLTDFFTRKVLPNEETIAVLISLLRLDDTTTIYNIFKALLRVPEKSEKVIPYILILFETKKDTSLQGLASRLLSCMGEKSIPALERILQSPFNNSRRLAIEALGKIKTKKTATLLIELLKKETNVYLKCEIINALKRHGSLAAPSLDMLYKIYTEFKGYYLTNPAYSTMKTIGKASIPYFLKTLQHKQPYIVARSLEALGELKAKSHVKRIKSFLRNKDRSIRQSAERAIRRINAK